MSCTPAPSTPKRRARTSIRRRRMSSSRSVSRSRLGATPTTPRRRAAPPSPRLPPRTTPRKRAVPHTPLTVGGRTRSRSSLRGSGSANGGVGGRVSPGKGRVQVKVRVRPMVGEETGRMAVTNDDTNVTLGITETFNKNFTFDKIFGTESSQEDVFQDCAKPIVDGVLHGFNGTIFAYGQTGSGKTYTMLGQCDEGSSQRGIMPRAIEHIFAQFAVLASHGWTYSCSCSFVEIYNESITDLLDADAGPKLLRESRSGVFVAGLTQTEVSDTAAAMEVVHSGLAARRVACTRMNHQSSRAHAVFTMHIKGQRKGMFGDTLSRNATLHLIDLAGSERQRDTGATGLRLKEASAINKSLSALGNVIKALVESQSDSAIDRHVNFRDSKLTFMLKDSLGGNCKTCMIANVSPVPRYVAETLSTFQFASRAKMIKNKAKANTGVQHCTTQMAAAIKTLKKTLSQHQIALKALAPAVDSTSLPEDIASVVAQVMANEDVQAVAGARGLVLLNAIDSNNAEEDDADDDNPTTNPSVHEAVSSRAGEEGAEENKGQQQAHATDAALAQRLQQLEDLNHELLTREKDLDTTVEELHKVVRFMQEQKQRHTTDMKLKTLMVTNMHKHMKRATTHHNRRSASIDVGGMAAAAAVAAASSSSSRNTGHSSPRGGYTTVPKFMSPPPVSPRTLRVLEECTTSSDALHRAATAPMDVRRPSLSPMRSRDGRSSLSPLKTDENSHPSGATTPVVMTVAASGAENADPRQSSGRRSSSNGKSKTKHRFRFADVVNAVVKQAGHKRTESAPAVTSSPANRSPAPHVGRQSMKAVEKGVVLVPQGQKYVKLLKMFRSLRQEHLALGAAKKAVEAELSAARQALDARRDPKQEEEETEPETNTDTEAAAAAATAAATAAVERGADADRIAQLQQQLAAAQRERDDARQQVRSLEQERDAAVDKAASAASATEAATLAGEQDLQQLQAEFDEFVASAEAEQQRLRDQVAHLESQMAERDMGAKTMEAMNKVLEAKVTELQRLLEDAEQAQAKAASAAPGLRSLLSPRSAARPGASNGMYSIAQRSYADLAVSSPDSPAVHDPLMQELQQKLAERSARRDGTRPALRPSAGAGAGADDGRSRTGRSSTGRTSEDSTASACSHASVGVAAGGEHLHRPMSVSQSLRAMGTQIAAEDSLQARQHLLRTPTAASRRRAGTAATAPRLGAASSGPSSNAEAGVGPATSWQSLFGRMATTPGRESIKRLFPSK